MQKASFLPSDFLAHIGHGDGLCPVDATGMMMVGGPRGKSMQYNTKVFGHVKRGLGLGVLWSSDGPLWSLRSRYTGQRLMRVASDSPYSGSLFSGLLGPLAVGLGAGKGCWDKIFQEQCNDQPETCILLHGVYEDSAEILRLPPSRITSIELNSTIVSSQREPSPTLVFPVSACNRIMGELLSKMSGGRASAPRNQAVSVRFTDGSSLSFLGLPDDHAASTNMFKSRVEVGCQGGSLGYHLVESSDMRRVITLHASPDKLISDLQRKFAGCKEVELCRGLLHQGEASALLDKRLGFDSRYSAGSLSEVMAMRISHPTVHAVMACAAVMPHGQVQYDQRNDALYPISHDERGNLRRDAACALILEILQKLQEYQRRNEGSFPEVDIVRFRNIY